LDKASPHYRSKKVRAYFERNKDALIPIYLPTAYHHRVYGNGGGGLEYSQA